MLSYCLLNLEKYNDAKDTILVALNLAKKMKNKENIIDCLALQAELEFKIGNYEKTDHHSNALLNHIEKMSTGFSKRSLLTSYRQKVYDYLKNSVVYELALNRIDSAFIKLEYAKARSLKKYMEDTNTKIKYADFHKISRSLPKRSLLIDYLIHKNVLYAFVLFRGNLTVFKKELDMIELKKKVIEYKDNIHNTIEIFNKYNPQLAEHHFQQTSQISHELFQILFNWKQLELYLDNVDYLFIIPDDYLFDIPYSTLVVESNGVPTYLIQKMAITYLPSASFVKNENKLNIRKKNYKKKVLLSADRKFSGTQAIINVVKKTFPDISEPILKNTITNKEMLERLDSEIYFIIGHGSANQKYPEYSKLDFSFLNSESGKYKTIPITVKDLESVTWNNAELVMLIGCETASGKIYPGTGNKGIQYGFLALGAQNVVGSLWPIDDIYALDQAHDFIELYSQDINPALILQRIQNYTIEKLKKNPYIKNAHPYYWGSFTHVLK